MLQDAFAQIAEKEDVIAKAKKGIPELLERKEDRTFTGDRLKAGLDEELALWGKYMPLFKQLGEKYVQK